MTDQKRIALVTGATSGIGDAIVANLLDQGHEVIGVGRKSTCRFTEHAKFRYERINLNDLPQLPGSLKELAQKYPGIDTLVCNAGRGQFGSVEEFSYPQIDDLIALNFTSQVYLTRAFMPLLKRQGRGDIIFMGSEAALSGGRKGAIYSATKFAVRGFAQALRDEVSKGGIRITVINPGMVKTPFFDNLSFEPGMDEANYILPEDVAKTVNLVLSSRPSLVFDEINLSPLKKVIHFKNDTRDSK
jgi:NADP-dependent 3-hydroxy acid dehydrogenase YdfG